jgi:hypothetical protein
MLTLPSLPPRTFAHRAGTGIALLLALGILVGCSAPEPTSPDSTAGEESPSTVESTEVAPERVDIPTGLEARSFAEGIDDAELLSWVEAAIAEMKDPPTSFLGLIWPIGTQIDDDPDPQLFDGDMFREHTQALTDEDLDATVATFREWQSNLVCAEGMDEREMEDGAKRVERWITGGADVATAPDPCFRARSGVYAWPEGVSKTTATEVWFHETYHGLSNYLIRQCSVAENQPEEKYEGIRWFSEGTAEYFGNYMAAKIEGRDDYVQVILRKAYNDYRGDPGADFNNAYFQAAGIQLMIERGTLDAEKVKDGSYFNDCAYMETFDPGQAEPQYIAENFGQIVESGGRYQFSEDAING